MLKLSEQQFQAVQEPAFEAQIERLCDTLGEHFDRQREIMGAAAFEKTVRLARNSARPFGLVSDRALFLFTAVVLMFGSGVLDDPQYPWARKALAGAATGGGGYRRALRLYEQAMTALDQFIGPDDEEHLRVMVRVKKLKPADAAAMIKEDFDDGAHAVLKQLHPMKYAALSDAAHAALIAQALKIAKKHKLKSAEGRLACVIYAFLMGASFDEDPKYPWAHAALTDPGTHEEKADRLIKAGQSFVERSLRAADI